MTDAGIALLAALGVVGQVSLVIMLLAAAGWLVPALRGALRGPTQTIASGGLWLAWGVALVATLGSLWLSNGAHFIPCHMCIQQRWFMYPLVGIILVLAFARRWWLTLPAMLVPIAGAFISVRHVRVQMEPEVIPESCKIGVPCTVKYIQEFGYITIPLLALTAFSLIIVLLGICGVHQWAHRRRPRSS